MRIMSANQEVPEYEQSDNAEHELDETFYELPARERLDRAGKLKWSFAMGSPKHRSFFRNAGKWRRAVLWVAANWELCREPEYLNDFHPADPKKGFNMTGPLMINFSNYVFRLAPNSKQHGYRLWPKIVQKCASDLLQDVERLRGNVQDLKQIVNIFL